MSHLDDIELARALHVLFITHWIGGVAFVTLVALPHGAGREDGWPEAGRCSRRSKSASRRKLQWSIPLAGATGLWMAWRLDLWAQFADPGFWWLDAMALVWALFMVIVFVIEPVAHARLAAEAARDPQSPSAASGARSRRPARGGDCHNSRRGRRRAWRTV